MVTSLRTRNERTNPPSPKDDKAVVHSGNRAADHDDDDDCGGIYDRSEKFCIEFAPIIPAAEDEDEEEEVGEGNVTAGVL